MLIEKFVKVSKCHRMLLDQETTYLERTMATIKEHNREVKEEQLSLTRETNEGEI